MVERFDVNGLFRAGWVCGDDPYALSKELWCVVGPLFPGAVSKSAEMESFCVWTPVDQLRGPIIPLCTPCLRGVVALAALSTSESPKPSFVRRLSLLSALPLSLLSLQLMSDDDDRLLRMCSSDSPSAAGSLELLVREPATTLLGYVGLPQGCAQLTVSADPLPGVLEGEVNDRKRESDWEE